MKKVLTKYCLRMWERKSKKWHKLFFGVEVASCVILAFSLGWEKTSYWGDKEFRAGIFFGFLIGGPLASYCSALLLYGFGELVDKIGKMQNSNVTSGGLEKASAARPTVASAQKMENHYNHYVDSFIKSEDRKSAGQCDVQPIACENSSFVKCPTCGLTQNARNTVCSMCGQRFIEETNME